MKNVTFAKFGLGLLTLGGAVFFLHTGCGGRVGGSLGLPPEGGSAPKRWSFPSSLADSISPTGLSALDPTLAMNAKGDAIFSWRQTDGSLSRNFKSEYRDGTWRRPAFGENISPLAYSAAAPRVAIGEGGEIVIVWQQTNGAHTQIFKSEYRGGAWVHPSSINDNISPDLQNATAPSVMMDPAGNTIITWLQSDGANQQVFKSEYRNGSWTHPSSLSDNISPDGYDASSPRTAMANGHAVITWLQSDGANQQVFKSEYRGVSWANPSSLADNISPNGYDVKGNAIRMDSAGNTLIAWVQSDSANAQIFKSEYRVGSGWAHPSSLADNISPDGYDAAGPTIAMDANNALILWTQSDATYSRLLKSEYRNGIWGHPASIAAALDPGGSNVNIAGVQMHAGLATIIYGQHYGGFSQLYRADYQNGAWSFPATLADTCSIPGYHAYDAVLATSGGGEAVVAFRQNVGAYSRMFKAELRAGQWTCPRDVSEAFSIDGTALVPMAKMDSQGNAVIGWRQSNGVESQVYVAQYR